MKSRENRIDRLREVLERLSRGEIVQNRQLKTLLGVEDYARYCDDCREQEQLRKMLGDKPMEIIEYERRLKAATFACSKADSKSVKGQHTTSFGKGRFCYHPFYVCTTQQRAHVDSHIVSVACKLPVARRCLLLTFLPLRLHKR